MWIANRNTSEKMSDGGYRKVPAGTPLINPETLRLPRIKDWADFVEDDSEAAEKGREYLKKAEAERTKEEIVDAEFEEVSEVEEVVDEEKKELVENTDSEDVEKVEETEAVDTSKYEVMANSQLKKMLKAANVEYKNSMNKATLMNLCAENNL